MIGTVGVAISTTGQAHRLEFLETSVRAWRASFDGPLFVTVDGSEYDAEAVASLVGDLAQVWQCGRPVDRASDSRQGVAINKNTGLELLMDARVDRLFLSDDDAWPLHRRSLDEHIALDEIYDIPHSSVCWGHHRAAAHKGTYASWTWPRGSVLYVSAPALMFVGGMVEAFGVGGHEHVEWSRRFRLMGLTPDDYCTPQFYLDAGPDGRAAMGARHIWYCEDMPLPGEALGSLVSRRRRLTSVQRTAKDTAKQELIMADMEANPRFVPWAAHLNGRRAATMCLPQDVTVPRSQS